MRKKVREDHYRDGEIAITIAAQALSKQAIKEEIEAKGERLALVKPAEINARAKVYLEQNPALWYAAWERAWHSGQIDQSVGNIGTELLKVVREPLRRWVGNGAGGNGRRRDARPRSAPGKVRDRHHRVGENFVALRKRSVSTFNMITAIFALNRALAQSAGSVASETGRKTTSDAASHFPRPSYFAPHPSTQASPA